MNLADVLVASATRSADSTALVMGQRRTSYAKIEHASRRVAGLLAHHGVGPGDRVGVMLPNVPEFTFYYYGVLRAGAVVVPMNPLLKARDVAHYLADSGVALLLAWDTAADEAAAGAAQVGEPVPVILSDDASLEFLDEYEAIDAVVDRDPEDTAVILYTSGTTGQPKGAELTHRNLLRNVEVTQHDLLRLGDEDVVFGGLPLFHSFGQTVTLNATVAAGASLVLLSRFAPAAALELMVEHGVTVFAGVPTMYSGFLAVDGAPALPTLRICVSGGAALPVKVLRHFEERFGCEVLEGYGLSETSPVASFNKPGTARKPGSIGTPVTGVEMQIVDEDGTPLGVDQVGEIAIRGHNVMKGYWGNGEATSAAISEDGWFRTGDIGRVDDDGFFFVVDRKKDLVIRGGFNVYPREIEEVLHEHSAVAEAAVVGLPHPELGEEVAALVTLRPGAKVTESELRDFVKGQVAPYKYPRLLWLVDELPKGPTGKIQKREITLPDVDS
ncbi:long-chain fatty acid--CoA ligase [Nesterenkonia sp. CL21]|uniref:long-chain-fatty-acid--CoA ligase n=1 Tax=Nesterenkonia sp. CL21 TaxID=3064894 RepID=UPI002879EA3A|nr:long-chain fatty acid--CoA ligase [Nesterenkonia sp. CL21]MDS2174109.1 long-chain fatty acid--CoA ligase [Nesterenkonia sp. CL21]